MKKALLPLILILIAIIAFLPSILSGPVGKPFVIRYLENRFNGNIAIEDVQFAWNGPQTFKNVTFANSETIATIRQLQSPVPFWKLQDLKRDYHFQNGTFTFPTYNAQIIQTNAEIQDSDVHVIAATPQGGSLNVQGKYHSKEDYHLNVELQQIPSIAIAQFLKIELLPLALGPTVDLQGVFSQSSIHANLSSPQATATLKGMISNNVLTLSEPFHATLRVSNALKAELLKRMSPNILTDFSLKNPITLTVPSGSMQLPFSQLSVTKAVIDFGQAEITSGESLHAVLSVFKNIGMKFDAWLTPITFSIHHCNTQIERFDALLDQNIHVCSWGEIRNDKLRMTLGVPAETLKALFDVDALLPNYVLTIPIRGSIQNPKFETGAAITKLATITAAKHLPTKAGKLFGEAATIFAQTQDDQNIPPPKRPFPWER